MIAIIPARAGSKRLPGKNKRMFAGKPLMQWTIDQAHRCGMLPVVTTDDTDIMRIAGDRDALIISRPAILCGDETSMGAVLMHAVTVLGLKDHERVTLLQCTSPLRQDYDIRQAQALFAQEWNGNSSRQMFVHSTNNPGGQSNGAIYIYPASTIRKFIDYENAIDYVHAPCIDINTLADFEAAEKEMNVRLSQNMD